MNTIVGVLRAKKKDVIKFLKKRDVLASEYSDNVTKTYRNFIFPDVYTFAVAHRRGHVRKTPIIFDSASALLELDISQNLWYADADILDTGIIHFCPTRYDELAQRCNDVWNLPKWQRLYYMSKENRFMFVLGKIIASMPRVSRRHFLMAIADGFKDDFTYFKVFVRENRLVSTGNKKYFVEFVNKLFAMADMPRESMNEEEKEAMYYLDDICERYKNYNIKDYVDCDNNII